MVLCAYEAMIKKEQMQLVTSGIITIYYG